MSGGSFNYLYSKMVGDSFLDSLFSYGSDLLDEARKALAEYTPSATDEREGRPLTAEERALAEEALAELAGLIEILQKVGKHFGDREYYSSSKPDRLREIMHSVEWMVSGDSGRDDVVGRLVEAGRTRRERATLRLVEEPAGGPTSPKVPKFGWEK